MILTSRRKVRCWEEQKDGIEDRDKKTEQRKRKRKKLT
jgi:hypothetical protein